MFMGEPKFQHIEFFMLAIAKGWGKTEYNTYPELLDAFVKAYAVEYIDLSHQKKLLEKLIVQRWLQLNEKLHLFNIIKLMEEMEPWRNFYHGYPNEIIPERRMYSPWVYDARYDAGFYGNWVKGILCNIGVLDREKIEGFDKWLIDNNYTTKEDFETRFGKSKELENINAN